jgi:tetratricopeptide (TPR) repeat protein
VQREAESLTTPVLASLSTRVRTEPIDQAAVDGSMAAARRHLEAAAMLHTECATRDNMDDSGAALHAGMAHELLSVDRVYVQRARSSAQMSNPAELLDREHALAFLPRWYALMSSALVLHGLDAAALKLVDEEAKLFPHDPRAVFAHGLVDEFRAAWNEQRIEPFSSYRPSRDPSGFDLIANTRLWGPILSEYKDVVASEPDNHEARVHLAWAHMSMRRNDEARKQLETVIAKAADPYVLYLADLFLARLDEDKRDFDAAAQRYRHAVEIGPKYQSAYIAWSLLADRRGQREEAQAIVVRFLSIRGRDREFDPWWVYRISRLPQADLDWLRSQVRK